MKRKDVEELLKDVEESQRKAIVDGVMGLHQADVDTHKKELESKDDEITTRDTKITDLTDKVKEFDGVDVRKLQEDVDSWKNKYNEDLTNERKTNAIKLAVAKERPRNEKALMALLDGEIIKLNDDGTVTGLKEQLETIKKENEFLFEVEKETDVDLGGDHEGGTPPPKDFNLNDAVKEHYEEE